MIDRREFFRYLGYGSAGMAVLPHFLKGCSMNGNGNEDHYVNFEGIMPIAIVSDCSRLVLANGVLKDPIRTALTADINLRLPGNPSRLGSSIPFDDVTLLGVLEQLKQKMDPGSDRELMKLSLLMGWIIFHPLKKSMTQVFSKLVDQGYHYDSIRVYLDTYLIRQVSGIREDPELDYTEFTNFFQALLPRMVTRLHTLKPDYNEGPEWVNRMSDWRSANRELTEKYGELIAREDREMHDQVIRRYNVYDPGDRLIQLVRNMDHGTNPAEIEKLIMSDPGNSLYTRGLVSAYNNVMAAQEYFDGEIDLARLKKQL